MNTYPPHFHIKLPPKPRDISEVFSKMQQHQDDVVAQYLKAANSPNYLSWDRAQYLTPPEGINNAEGWSFIHAIRTYAAAQSPITAESGERFVWIRLPYTDEYLHHIDMHAGGQISLSNNFSSLSRQTLITRGLIEEAIASSQLEGAHTTRQTAKKMLLEKRHPKNESEQMIVNNYQTMLALEAKYKNQKLTLALLIELHHLLTVNTAPSASANRFRQDSDHIVVQGQIGQAEYVTHVPPKAKFVQSELQKLLLYANDQDKETFTHPIIKAIFLHFWIGYLHPFTDGNGRLARAVFYWYLLKNGYWTFMYLPISTVIKKAPIQYAMAYIYSEQDGCDLTYFYEFHMRKIMLALKEFQDYIGRKQNSNREIDALIQQKLNLNARQTQLLYHLLSDKSHSTTITSHSTINNISRQTASKDLGQLVNNGILHIQKTGKTLHYYGSPKFYNLLQSS